jgi:hypothetical protein
MQGAPRDLGKAVRPLGCASDNVGGSYEAGDSGPPAPPAVCTDPIVNTEPEILVGNDPAMVQTVGETGQIRVWITDECPPFVALGEQVDSKTGTIKAAGDRTATAKDGLLYEPALYIAPQSPTNGGTPYFPQWINLHVRTTLCARMRRHGPAF